MYFLYILKSEVKDWHYIGVTKDLTNRVAEHNAGEVRSSRGYRPLKLLYQEKFLDKNSARKREIFLKRTGAARKELFEKIKNTAPIV